MTNKDRLDRHDIQIAAIRTLAASQKKTDANLNALISTLRVSGGNG
jgi:hypothetical protein